MHDGNAETQTKIVWARGDITTDRCPVSIVTASSKAWLERYYLWKSAGSRLNEEMASRDAEAFLVLLEAEQKELRNGQNTVTQ